MNVNKMNNEIKNKIISFGHVKHFLLLELLIKTQEKVNSYIFCFKPSSDNHWKLYSIKLEEHEKFSYIKYVGGEIQLLSS